MTFDTDHMTDHTMAVFQDEILPPEFAYSFFCYKPFPVLAARGHELAIHPHLEASESWVDKIRAMRAELSLAHGEEPMGLRPHSLACSQNLIVQLNSLGLEYVSTISLPAGMEADCFRYPWGPVEIPIRYMDNMDLWARDKTGLSAKCFARETIDRALDSRSAFCFDFHPIHIFLNTSTFGDYEAWVNAGRPPLERPVQRQGYGVRDFFLEICNESAKRGLKFTNCRDAARQVARAC